MSGYYIEQRHQNGNSSLSWDLAHHLLTRQITGKIIVIGEKPDVLLSSLKKQWLKLTRRVQRERSSTLDAPRIVELTKLITHMQELTFTSEEPLDQPQADVFIVDATKMTDILPVCNTIYITCDVDATILERIAECAPPNSLIVSYDEVIKMLIKSPQALV